MNRPSHNSHIANGTSKPHLVLSFILLAFLLTSSIAFAQSPPPVQNVPLVNDTKLPSGMNISNMARQV